MKRIAAVVVFLIALIAVFVLVVRNVSGTKETPPPDVTTAAARAKLKEGEKQ